MSKFDAADPDTWTPELRITVAALDEVSSTDEASYLLGYVMAMVEAAAESNGVALAVDALLDAWSRIIGDAYADAGLVSPTEHLKEIIQ